MSYFPLQVATSLPKTSYFKLVDVWLLFCIFATFFIIVFHILIDFLQNRAHTIVRTRHGCPLRDAALGKPNQQMLMVSERFFLSSAKVQGVQLEPLVHQQKSQEPRKSNWKDAMGISKDKNKIALCGGGDVWAPVRCAEIFARVCMFVVFMIFDVTYWITAYVY